MFNLGYYPSLLRIDSNDKHMRCSHVDPRPTIPPEHVRRMPIPGATSYLPSVLNYVQSRHYESLIAAGPNIGISSTPRYILVLLHASRRIRKYSFGSTYSKPANLVSHCPADNAGAYGVENPKD